MQFTYSEQEMFAVLRRLSNTYINDVDNRDREIIEKFVQWCHHQYGYDFTELSKRDMHGDDK